jgi:hypothetical protein
MKHNGNIDLQHNLLKNFRLEAVENFPADPKAGSFIFKDKRVMVCVELDAGLPIWFPLTAQRDTFKHTQSVAATTWIINHDLNVSTTVANIIGVDGKHVIPDEITQTYNQTIVTFLEPQAGRAILVSGQEDGYDPAPTAFEQSFTNLSTWVVNHMLGEEPVIRVFIANNEVQPLSIVHNSTNQTTVTFSTPRTGKVRCIV